MTSQPPVIWHFPSENLPSDPAMRYIPLPPLQLSYFPSRQRLLPTWTVDPNAMSLHFPICFQLDVFNQYKFQRLSSCTFASGGCVILWNRPFTRQKIPSALQLNILKPIQWCNLTLARGKLKWARESKNYFLVARRGKLLSALPPWRTFCVADFLSFQNKTWF